MCGRSSSAGPGVLDVYPARQHVLDDPHPHRTARGRVLHAVLEDVLERLDAPGDVTDEARALGDVGLEGDVRDVERDGERLDAPPQELRSVDGGVHELDHAGVDARELEQGGHEVFHTPLEALHQPKPLDQVARVTALGQAVAHQLGRDRYRGERRLELMRDVCEGVRERELLGLELIDGQVQSGYDFVDLTRKDRELALLHIAKADVALARQDAIEVVGHAAEGAVASRGERHEDRGDDGAGQACAARCGEGDGPGRRTQGEGGRRGIGGRDGAGCRRDKICSGRRALEEAQGDQICRDASRERARDARDECAPHLAIPQQHRLPLRLVAHAAHGLDEVGAAGVLLDLVAQPFDVHGQRVLLDVRARAVPQGVTDLVARD